MTDARALLLNEIRYSERLCQRTARLYRNVQFWGGVFTALGATAAVASLGKLVPGAVSLAGGLVAAVLGIALMQMRAADKAAQNEADMRRYTQLRAKANSMDDEALRAAIDEARSGDAAELEALRDVVFNDVAEESGRPDVKVNLTAHQRFIAAIA